MDENERSIPLAACQAGHVYRLRSRNLVFGVFDGRDGFIGIRIKFNSRYLFTELHYDTGAPYGTVRPLEDLGPLPGHLVVADTLGTQDLVTRRPLTFDRPRQEGGRGWFFSDDGSASAEIVPVSVPNTALFEHLDQIEAVRSPGPCRRCGGSGRYDDAPDKGPCWTCGGTGRRRSDDAY